VGAGLTEAYTWSLVAEDPDPDALKLTDPLGTDQARLRTTLLPGLVAAAQHNLDSGSSPIALFEVARVYLPGEEALPDERWRVGVIVEGGFEAARAVAEVVYDALHLELELGRASHPLLHPGKSGATPAGVVGELHPTALDGLFGVCELDLAALLAPMPERILYQDVITYPALRRDIAVVVDETVEAGEITGLIRAAGSSDLQEAAVFDVYRGDQVGAGRKSVAVRLTFQSPERTLSDDEAAVLVERILATLHDSVGAELRAV
jgi:phenylalanyl-tRNA synthetase beta chain